MTETTHDIIEGIAAALLIGRAVMSHIEHKKTNKDVNEIKFYINGDFEKKLEEEKKKWEQENKKQNESI